MRWLAPSLLALSLLFSTGGVAVVGRADSNATGTAVTDPPSQCTVAAPMPAPDQTATARPRAAKRETPSESIVLNTSGYNYTLQGEWHPDPVGSPQGVPEGVLPRELEQQPPAAPEAR